MTNHNIIFHLYSLWLTDWLECDGDAGKNRYSSSCNTLPVTRQAFVQTTAAAQQQQPTGKTRRWSSTFQKNMTCKFNLYKNSQNLFENLPQIFVFSFSQRETSVFHVSIEKKLQWINFPSHYADKRNLSLPLLLLLRCSHRTRLGPLRGNLGIVQVSWSSSFYLFPCSLIWWMEPRDSLV